MSYRIGSNNKQISKHDGGSYSAPCKKESERWVLPGLLQTTEVFEFYSLVLFLAPYVPYA